MTEQVDKKLVNLGQLKKAIDKKAGSTSQSQDQYAKAITVEDSSKYDEKMELLCSTIKDFAAPSKDSHKALIAADYANKQKIAENYTALDCSVWNNTNYTHGSHQISKRYYKAYTCNSAIKNNAAIKVANDSTDYIEDATGAVHSIHADQTASKDKACVLVADELYYKNDSNVTGPDKDEQTKSVALTTDFLNLPSMLIANKVKQHFSSNELGFYSTDLNIDDVTKLTTDCLYIKKFFTAKDFVKFDTSKLTPDKNVSNEQEMVVKLGIEAVGIKHNEDFYAKDNLKPFVAYLTLDNVTMYKPIPEGDFEAYFN